MIIGLLIGGILVAQSLIESAKVHNDIKQLQEFKYAYEKFRETFRQKPGDYDGSKGDIGVTSIGNNDGSITATEMRKIWIQLTTMGYLDLENPADYPYLSLEDPSTSTGIQDLDIIYLATGYVHYGSSNESGVGDEDIITFASWDIPSVLAPSYKALYLLALDKKMDDGLPWSGSIRGHRGRHSGVYTNCSYDNAGTQLYKIDEAEENCRMIFLIERY